MPRKDKRIPLSKKGAEPLFLNPARAATILLIATILAACNGLQPAPQPSRLPVSATPVLETTPLLDNSSTTPPAVQPQPLQQPSPSATLATSEDATLTPWPTTIFTITKGPSPTNSRTATPTATITNTATPPFAYVRLQRPGELSKVVSPFRMEAVVSPGEDGYIHVDLFGEDGRTITHQDLDFRNNIGRRFLIGPDIFFSIAGVAETSRLNLYVVDQFGRTKGLASVQLILLQLGSNELNPPLSLQEPYLIRQPKENNTISGGLLTLQGLARPVNDNLLKFELIDEQNKIIASAEQYVAQPGGDLSHTPFTVNIPYSVSTTTPVRLIIRQESNTRIPGTIALTSLLLVLTP